MPGTQLVRWRVPGRLRRWIDHWRHESVVLRLFPCAEGFVRHAGWIRGLPVFPGVPGFVPWRFVVIRAVVVHHRPACRAWLVLVLVELLSRWH